MPHVLTATNSLQILQIADQLQLQELKQKVLDFVVEQRLEVVSTDAWAELQAQSCASLLAEVAEAICGIRRKNAWEFPEGTVWQQLSVPRLQRALTERGLGV